MAMSGNTGSTGGGLPFDNYQTSLAVTMVTPQLGVFPSGGGGGSAIGDTLGFIYDFAGNFPPGSGFLLQGQTLSISANDVLFALIGTTYGGDGQTNFMLPDLQGRTLIGMGTGPGLSPQTIVLPTGTSTVTLSTSQIPAHDHTLTGGGVTGTTGGGLAFSNMQPSLPVETLIAISGVFPSQGGNNGSATFLGQMANFEGDFVPSGWAAAAGQLLPIASNQALFSVLGTTFGGDGKTNFALPDLRGRVAVGVDGTHPLGSVFGEEATTLDLTQLPAHDHTDPGGVTGTTGGSQPVNNVQPSLAVNYLIATSGVFPPRDTGAGFDTNSPIIGQITEFAGDFAPSGWAFANGQLLPISANTALFSILGTQYGGDGKTTFALPDLRGNTIIGASSDLTSFSVGGLYGSAATTLTVAELPAHTHTLPCFAEGTRIATESGPVAVERLMPGDGVLTANGSRRGVVQWLGHRSIDCTRHPNPRDVWPVRVRAGAFGNHQPQRDLFLSPDHGLFVDEVLIPVKYLLNDMSIVQVPVDQVTYYHVELLEHSILLAEGLPAESYLDTGDRTNFANGDGPVALHADFSSRVWEAEGCAPLVVTGETVDRVRQRLNAMARPAQRADSDPQVAAA
jgi:microcystin-dependent protein